MEIMSVTLYKD